MIVGVEFFKRPADAIAAIHSHIHDDAPVVEGGGSLLIGISDRQPAVPTTSGGNAKLAAATIFYPYAIFAVAAKRQINLVIYRLVLIHHVRVIDIIRRQVTANVVAMVARHEYNTVFSIEQSEITEPYRADRRRFNCFAAGLFPMDLLKRKQRTLAGRGSVFPLHAPDQANVLERC